MLLELTIQNIALIEQMRIEFSQGLTVLTGETGAGKSIVVDSVNLVLGARADRELIRTGEEKACVRALFDISAHAEARAYLAERGIDAEDGLIELSRELTRSGRNICRVNGAMLPLANLKELTAMLVDVHGQHEHQALLNPARHIAFMDSFGDDAHHALLRDVQEKHRLWREAERAFSRVDLDASERERRRDMLSFQYGEIAAARLKPGEDEKLEKKNRLNENAEKIAAQLETAYERIYRGSRAASAQEQLKRAADALSQLSGIDEKYGALQKRVEDLYYSAQDAGLELQSMLDEAAFDPTEAEKIADRLDLLKRLCRKYGPELADVIAYGQKAEAELKEIDEGDDTRRVLMEKRDAAKRVFLDACRALSDSRAVLSDRLCAAVVGQLRDLGMGRTRFEARMAQKTAPDQNGSDDVEFLISPNPGEPVKPLAAIASGGELSRIMLAMKAIAADLDGVGTMIFDEIDTGVSGRMAQVVGEKMCMLGRNRQVICVTHLMQIAALADNHFMVEKMVEGERTGTNVVRLTEEGRVKEIARLVGGAEDVESAFTHARSMLLSAAARKTALSERV